jgi:hypothetical protein
MTMLIKGFPRARNFLKITFRKMLLKIFLTSTCIMTQLGCRSKKALMPKRMVPQGYGLSHWIQLLEILSY